MIVPRVPQALLRFVFLQECNQGRMIVSQVTIQAPVPPVVPLKPVPPVAPVNPVPPVVPVKPVPPVPPDMPVLPVLPAGQL